MRTLLSRIHVEPYVAAHRFPHRFRRRRGRHDVSAHGRHAHVARPSSCRGGACHRSPSWLGNSRRRDQRACRRSRSCRRCAPAGFRSPDPHSPRSPALRCSSAPARRVRIAVGAELMRGRTTLMTVRRCRKWYVHALDVLFEALPSPHLGAIPRVTLMRPDTFVISTTPAGPPAPSFRTTLRGTRGLPAASSSATTIILCVPWSSLLAEPGLVHGREHAHLVLIRIDEQLLQQRVSRVLPSAAWISAMDFGSSRGSR